MTEPFIITCETCRGRLRVRSAEAIGTIVACPKCQSLVHISAPEPKSETEPAPPASVPTESARATSHRSVWLTLSLAAAALAVTVTVGLVLGRADTPPANDSRVIAGVQEPLHDEPDVEAAPAAERTPDAEEGAPPASEYPSAPAPEVAAADRRDALGDAKNRQAPPVLPDLDPVEIAAGALDQQTRAPGREEQQVPRVGLPGLDLVLSADGQEATRQDSRPAAPRDGARPDAPFQKDPPSEVAGQLPPGAPEAATSSVPRVSLERAGSADQNVSPMAPGQALSLPLAEVSWGDASLLDVVRVLSDLTGATITVTPEAYLAVDRGAGFASPHQGPTTAGSLLVTVLDEHGLAYEEHGHHLVIGAGAAGRVDLADARGKHAPSDLLVEKLHRRITYSFTEPSPLAEVLRHLGSAGGLTLLVDWESLAACDLSPQTPVTSSVLDLPLQGVLDGVLPPLELDWIAVGDDAIWITTRESSSRG